jgi:hypothetical protein
MMIQKYIDAHLAFAISNKFSFTKISFEAAVTKSLVTDLLLMMTSEAASLGGMCITLIILIYLHTCLLVFL